ncbi:hypothetical protein GOODEAATRI_001755 [Goodea atripinnis]|uniref:Uncharacterized protein n=1 Tax=Goodea atripinnis TaxID=208336 RepID=A0ABV0PV89_9TELE
MNSSPHTPPRTANVIFTCNPSLKYARTVVGGGLASPFTPPCWDCLYPPPNPKRSPCTVSLLNADKCDVSRHKSMVGDGRLHLPVCISAAAQQIETIVVVTKVLIFFLN